MCTSTEQNQSLFRDPDLSPSILAAVPECLREALQKIIVTQPKGRKPVLVSSNGLANRFILSRWGIRPSQRRRYRQLFSSVRKQCRTVFQYYSAKGWIEWSTSSGNHLLGVFKFDEIRGNLILGFVPIPPGSEWTLGGR